MAVADVVTVLTEYCADGEEAFRDLHGSEAVVVVHDLIDLLERELGESLDFEALWTEFEADPRATAPDLTGALEAIVEADPGFADQLEVLLQEYHASSRAGATEPEGKLPPEAETEFVPREETRVEKEEPRGHADDAGEGTYLYGNIPVGGDGSVGEALGLSPDTLGMDRGVEMLSFDVRGLFRQLRTTVETETDLSDERRKELSEALHELEAELALGEEADEDHVVEQLLGVGEMDPAFLGLVLTGLRHTRAEAEALVERAIERVGAEYAER